MRRLFSSAWYPATMAVPLLLMHKSTKIVKLAAAAGATTTTTTTTAKLTTSTTSNLSSLSSQMDFDHPERVNVVAAIQSWIDEEVNVAKTPYPTSMLLATTSPEGRPQVRAVMMRGFDKDGVVFYTNKQSRKGDALTANPYAALLFLFAQKQRQIRIEGKVHEVSNDEADAYFASRPLSAQIDAVVSKQSQKMEQKGDLDAAFNSIQDKMSTDNNNKNDNNHPDSSQSIPRPPHWVGYRVDLERVEFWQNNGGYSPSPDRVVFLRQNDGSFAAERQYP